MVVVVGAGAVPLNMNPIDCHTDCPDSYEPTVAQAAGLQHDTPSRKLGCEADGFGVVIVDHDVPFHAVNHV